MRKAYISFLLLMLLIATSYLAAIAKTSSESMVSKSPDNLIEILKLDKGRTIRGKELPPKPKPEYCKGSIIAKFKANIEAKVIKQELVSLNSQIVKEFKRTKISYLKVPQGKEVEVVKSLLKKGLVEFAEPDYVQKTLLIPNDPQFSSQWALHNDPTDTDIDAPEAWDVATGSSDVVVAVIDTGVDYNHEDLSANMWTNPGEVPGNGIDDDLNGYVDDIYGIDTYNGDGDPYDDHGHGTHCAGIIGAVGDNEIGITGVAWTVKIMALKFIGADGYGYTSGAIEALEYVMMMKALGVNVKVTSNSWGSQSYSIALYNAIKIAGDNGILFVAAAGNRECNADYECPLFPAAYDLPSIISVAASNIDGGLTEWSTYGYQSVDLAAPGEDILSTVPDNRYEAWSGTSMATPHVSGVAALLLSTPARAGYGPINLKFNILFTTDAAGLPLLTEGRLNAHNALLGDPSDTTLRMLILSPIVGYPVSATVGQSFMIEAMVGTYGGPVPGTTVTATIGSSTIQLKDDGLPPDKFPNDGVYSGEVILAETGSFIVLIHAEKPGYIPVDKTFSLHVWLFNNYGFSSIPFNWVEVSGIGMPLNLGDDGEALIYVPFDVMFYGSKYRVLGVGSNGAIAFDDSPADEPFNIRTGCLWGKMLFPFWDDLVSYPDCGLPPTSNVYFAILGTAPNRKLVIQYNNVSHFSWQDPSYSVTFEVVFYENSANIDVYYKDVIFFNEFYDQGPDKGGRATVGVQYSNMYYYGVYSDYSFNKPVLSNNMGLRLNFMPKLYFDMGTATSPVESGYTRVTHTTTFSSLRGYGWTIAPSGSRDRGAPDNLRRDLVFSSTDSSFKVLLPNGLYTVRLIIGDKACGHDKMDIYINGLLKVNDLSTAAGQFKEISLTTSVNAGELVISFHDDGGSDTNWVVNAIYIMEGAYFDFGTPTSPTYSDFIRVSSELYSPIKGYGWLSTYNLNSRDRGAPDYLLRDFVFSSYARTFVVDAPPGYYVINSLHMDKIASHEFTIDNLYYLRLPANTLKCYWNAKYYDKPRITLSDGWGPDINWIINGLIITSAPW